MESLNKLGVEADHASLNYFDLTCNLLLLFSFRKIPYFGSSLESPFQEYLKKQKSKLHVKPGTSANPQVKQYWLNFDVEYY